MKRIAIFCDGTWNKSDGKTTTNVVKLAQSVRPSAADGITQHVFYQPGVGTGRGSNAMARLTDRVLGGALGWGLSENIHSAYRDLAFCYEPGDRIFIFGFSRGAYTARSLAGLIRSAGIPPRDQTHRIKEAIAHYQARGKDTHPDSRASKRFRVDFSPHTATSSQDYEWRRDNGYNDCELLRIKYVGVWDTVGALGMPGAFGALAKIVNKKYAFHDADLSRSVAGARHAVAIDERRKLFPPTLWDNLDNLNGEATGEERPYRQEWFVGDHSIVGGSGKSSALSACSAQWISDGARERGLEFDREMLQEIVGLRDALAPLPEKIQPAGLWNLGGSLLEDRAGPDIECDLSDCARERVIGVADYRPGALRRILGALLR